MSLRSLPFDFVDISTCGRTWNFGPRQKRSEMLPAWAVAGELITGFDLEAPHPVHNVKADPDQASELMATMYPELSWPELARFERRPGVPQAFNIPGLYAKLGFQGEDHWQSISEALVQWPAAVQDFISEKALRPFDVLVVRGLELETQKDILSLLVTLRLSKSVFCQALELATELLLLQTPAPEVVELLKQKDILTSLKQKRFPRASAADNQLRHSAETWSWPKGCRGQFQRRGDIRGLEIQLFAKNSDELEKQLGGLRALAADWKKSDDETSV